MDEQSSPQPLILTVGAVKGGAGKTTLATNIAIAAAVYELKKVALIDADAQATAVDFTNLRSELVGDPRYTCVPLTDRAVKTQGAKIAQDYELTVVDVGGQNNTSLRAAMSISTGLLIPVFPRTYDLWSLERMAGIVEEARCFNPSLRAYAILSMADPGGTDNAEAAEMMKGIDGIEYLDTPIRRRKAWSHAAAAGKCVNEMRPRDREACQDLSAMMALLFARLRADTDVDA